MKFRAGDWVEIRGKEEILGSLDKNGRLEGVPFTPQMLALCGHRFKVQARAHKGCDTVNPIANRRLSNAVHLELRCDGKAYGGCQAACLLYWKAAWLKPVEGKADGGRAATVRGPSTSLSPNAVGCSEEDIWRGTTAGASGSSSETIYTCQATLHPTYTTPLPWWNLSQYVEDYTSGNVTLYDQFCGFLFLTYWHLALAKRERLGRPSRWLYDQTQKLWGGVPFPRRHGSIPADQTTPTQTLDLQPGELVRVKSYKEIRSTIDTRSFNRGLYFDAELVPYCGGSYRVRSRVSKFIDEKTGKMRTLRTPAVILEGVWCRSRYSNCRMFCPRAIPSWWREIWLERVPESADEPSFTRLRSAVRNERCAEDDGIERRMTSFGDTDGRAGARASGKDRPRLKDPRLKLDY